ncbi:PLP-dependent aminotransferase family protein [Paenibacillus sp. NPDC058177]|uniref:MocR-like pyridoxine biosynthesis transcription factor PdxR n=1 Tax=Paenibacillus sp. NPDC058177 TaxID=3346369 RepID=UPI0036DDDFF2
MWKPNRQSNRPVYLQIADLLGEKIAQGEYPPGSKLPSERKLAEQYKVNRSTVVLAYSELRSQGVIETRPGSGTLVSPFRQRSVPPTPSWQAYADSGNFLPNLPLLRRVREALEHDPGLIDFASGKLSLELVPTDEINRIISEYRYSPHEGPDLPQGYLPLRQALAEFLARYRGIQTTPDSIMVTSGSQQSLHLITQCLLSPGDAIGVESPSFFRSLSMFQSAGLRLFRLPVDDEGICPDSLRTLHRKHRIKMLFINPNFQNPTGTLLSRERRKLLLETASELRLPVVEDDPLGLTGYNGEQAFPLKSEDTASGMLYTGSFSRIAAPGLHIGWIVAPKSILSRLADARRQMDLGFSIIPQHIAAEFMSSPAFVSHLELLRQRLLYKRNLTISALERELPGIVSFNKPEGGIYLWCKLPGEINESRLLEAALQRGIAFVPGGVYGAESGYLRLAYSRPPDQDIVPGVTGLADAVRAELQKY